jgi:hypothetical protein
MRRGIGIGVVLLLILAARAIDTHVSLVEAHGGTISPRSESGKHHDAVHAARSEELVAVP